MTDTSTLNRIFVTATLLVALAGLVRAATETVPAIKSPHTAPYQITSAQ